VRFRTRAMLASVVLAVGFVALAPVASAQDEGGTSEAEAKEIKHHAEDLAKENGGTEADAECIALLADGKKVDDCQEAPSPIMPATDELLWGSITFVLLLIGIWKVGLPAIKKGMDARSERIRADLSAAEDAKSEAVGVLDKYRADLADAKAEAGRIIDAARQAADALKRDQETRLQAELAELRSKAAADVEAAKVQAIADLRGEVAQLAIGAAEVVVGHSLDQATQVQLIEDYINQVANQR
jgi:F-type H+-transporting ATPase subunit b